MGKKGILSALLVAVGGGLYWNANKNLTDKYKKEFDENLQKIKEDKDSTIVANISKMKAECVIYQSKKDGFYYTIWWFRDSAYGGEYYDTEEDARTAFDYLYDLTFK